MSDFRFELISGGASGPRLGRVHTAHGAFDTPAFLPVGTSGAVKTVTPEEVRACGAQAILANTYHLHLRPGEDLVRALAARGVSAKAVTISSHHGHDAFLTEWDQLATHLGAALALPVAASRSARSAADAAVNAGAPNTAS